MILLPVCPFVECVSCHIDRFSTTTWWVFQEGLVRPLVKVGLDHARTVATLFLTARVHIVNLFGLELAEHIHAVFAEKRLLIICEKCNSSIYTIPGGGHRHHICQFLYSSTFSKF